MQSQCNELQQHAGQQEQELAQLRSRSPAGAAGSGPHSADGASSRLREMHGQMAQQDSHLASIRAENQVCHCAAAGRQVHISACAGLQGLL